ncbi:MAG TPA: DNA repair protein RecN [Blastocatellia bacterium]|nr:DNA repair protein RecN [Blastocatellia bacterium]
MLRLLNINNVAVIDSLQLELRNGLNVLSGETGSGKSIIIDALGLLLGERATSDLIRTGHDRAFVEGVFDIEANLPLIELLADSGIEVDQDELIIRRELSLGGKGRIFVNSRAASATLLRAVQPHVIDLHGQGDQQSLLSSEAHLNLLDAFSGNEQRRQRTAQAYDSLLKLARELEDSRQSESERLQALDIVEFQLNELEQARLAAHEDEELEAERRVLANAEKLASICDEAYRYLYEDELSMLTRLGTVQRRLNDLTDLDPRFGPYLEQLISVKHLLDDTASFIRGYADGIQISPERLKVIEDRLVELDRLKRKYGVSIDELMALREKLADRREHLLRSEERSQSLDQQLRAEFERYQREADSLAKLRASVAPKFEQEIGQEMAEVALNLARFSVRLAAQANSQLAERLHRLAGIEAPAIRRTGREQVEFYFSANPGEDPRPLGAVASGGELSRLMLVLKTITAPSLFPRTLIFDEIDAGIGGKVADAVGQRLKRLAGTNQVLCVTHQSQIARYADAHFQVSKEVVAGRTITRIEELDNEGRVEELARMIGGTEVTPLARKHAKELLKTS